MRCKLHDRSHGANLGGVGAGVGVGEEREPNWETFCLSGVLCF